MINLFALIRVLKIATNDWTFFMIICTDREPMSFSSRDIECIICLQVLINPVTCSSCAKSICEEHAAGLRKCPNCQKEPLRFEVNRGLGLVVDQLQYPCRHCKTPIPKMNLDVHEKHCHGPNFQRRCCVPVCEFDSGARAMSSHTFSASASSDESMQIM